MIRVKKFSWNEKDQEASVSYVIERGKDGSERHSLECADKPKPELLEALQALAMPALEECEVVNYTEIAEMDAHVRSISYSWALDIMGASICLLVDLDHSDQPLVLNTPHKPSQPYSDGTSHTLPDALVNKLTGLHVLIERYIDGDRVRQQMDLFDEDSPEGSEYTISLNGGPDVPLSTVRAALAVVKGRAP